MKESKMEIATLGAGCFWCVEAIFNDLKDVESVVSGYAGGEVEDPTYTDVCTGSTGHAEVIQVKFDSSIISFKEILQIFFAVHDPTTPNQQGNDVGTQYRSAIFYHSEEQRRIADDVLEEIDAEGIWGNPIVTEITEFDKFYEAEDYHQEYFANNPNQPYCVGVVAPKVAKFRNKFLDRLKK